MTLITGELVVVDTLPTGQLDVTVEPVERDGRQASFGVVEDGDDVYVIPDGAAGLVPRTLDRALFNVTELIELGYHNGATGHLPVIVTYVDDPVPLPAVEVGAPLEGAAGVTASVAKADASALGRAIASGDERVLAGVQGIRLDRQSIDERERIGLTSPPPSVDEDLEVLVVEAIGPHGQPMEVEGARMHLMNLDDRNAVIEEVAASGVTGRKVYRVPEGTYSFFGIFESPHRLQGLGFLAPTLVPLMDHEHYLIGDPEFAVSADDAVTRVVLDAREAHEITVELDEDDPERTNLILQYWRQRDDGSSYQHRHHYLEGTTHRVFAVPTDDVTIGAFEHYTKWVFEPGEDTPAGTDPPYFYDLIFIEPDRIPDSGEVRAYDAAAHPVATAHNRFYNDTEPHEWNESRSVARPYDVLVTSFARRIDVPAERIDHMSALEDVVWWPRVYAEVPLRAPIFGPRTMPAPGEEVDHDWYKSPVRAGLLPPVHGAGVVPPHRAGDTLHLQIAELVDAQTGPHGHWGWAHTGFDENTVRYFIDGELAEERPYARTGTALPMKAEEADYRLETLWQRSADWWETSTRSETVWTFRSQRPDEDTERIPLVLVDVDLDLDLRNRLDGGQPSEIELVVRPQGESGTDGASGGDPADDDEPTVALRLFTSGDDGATWQEREVVYDRDNRFRAVFDQPDLADTNGFVSLRIQAEDHTDGSAVEQTVIRAYALTP